AYHEIGHALVAAMQKHSAPVHKITIIPRTSGHWDILCKLLKMRVYLCLKKKQLIK
ncbi:ATP-dependent zinc metalloprotease FtsH, partial [Clostridioides difficile]